MALIECRKKSDKNPFSVFKGKTYITTGLVAYSNRVTILDGGYCIENGLCYLKIKLKSNYNFATSQAVNNIPQPTDTGVMRGVLMSLTELEDAQTLTSDNFVYGGHYVQKTSGNVNTLVLGNFPTNTEAWVYAIYTTSAT